MIHTKSFQRKTDIYLHISISFYLAVDIKDRSVIQLIPRSLKPSAENFLIHHKQKLRKSPKMINGILSALKIMG